VNTWDLETAIAPVPGGVVLTAKGRVGRLTASRFADALTAARTQSSRLVIDLHGVDYISGAGLAALRDAADVAETLIVCGVGEALRNTLELGGLTDRVRIEESREAAIGMLTGGGKDGTGSK
jgi:anti-anti-sigma factor